MALLGMAFGAAATIVVAVTHELGAALSGWMPGRLVLGITVAVSILGVSVVAGRVG